MNDNENNTLEPEIIYDENFPMEEHTCPKCGCRHNHKFIWDWGKFWLGKVSNKLIAWVAYMVLQFITMLTGKIPEANVGTFIWVTAIVTFIFMLAGAIDTAVENAKITADFKAGIMKEIKKTIEGGK